jgi:uncharacterized membrane protein
MSDEQDAQAAARLDQFVDAAFAFAVTLLLITGAVPTSLEGMTHALLRIPASLGAFAMIAMYWTHHRQFGRLSVRRDSAVLLLSLTIVFVVLIYVFPLRLLTETAFHYMSGGRLPGQSLLKSYDDLQTLYVVYGVGFAVLSSLYSLLFIIGRRAPATDTAADNMTSHAWAWGIIAGIGVMSVLLAVVLPLHIVPWLPPMTYSLIPVAIYGRERLIRRPAAETA